MMWDCCNARGECVRGPGCPAGSVHHAKNFDARKTAAQEPRDFCAPGMCESAPGCRDTACPAHPGLRWSSPGLKAVDVARIKSRMPKHPQAQPTSWRRHLPDLITWMAKTLAALILLALVFAGGFCAG